MSGNEEVGRTEAVALQDVKQANFIVRFFRWLADVVRGWFERKVPDVTRPHPQRQI